MVSTNIQGPYPLSQSLGLNPNKKNHLQKQQPGDFRILHNMEILDGVLTRRRNLRCVHKGIYDEIGNVYNVSMFDSACRFVGVHEVASDGRSILLTRDGKQWACYPYPENNSDLLINPNGPGGENTYQGFDYVTAFQTEFEEPLNPTFDRSQFEGITILEYFQYGDKPYWLYVKVKEAPDPLSSFSPRIEYGLAVSDYTDAADPYPSLSSTLKFSMTEILTFDELGLGFDNCFVYHSFIYKDRLWLVTGDTVFFSKATDFTKFGVSDGGGFFKFPEDSINFAFAHNDSIYVLCDTSIHNITYRVDPNTDASVVRISDDVGAEYGCVHKDSPFVVGPSGIYEISNGRFLQLINNFHFSTTIVAWHGFELTSFGDYLVVNYYNDKVSGDARSYYDLWRSKYDNTVSLWSNAGVAAEGTISFNGTGMSVTSNGTQTILSARTLGFSGSDIGMSVKPNTIYTLQGLASYSGNEGPGVDYAFLVEYYDASNTLISSDTVGTTVLTTLDDQNTITGQFLTPATASYIRFVILANRTDASAFPNMDSINISQVFIQENADGVVTDFTAGANEVASSSFNTNTTFGNQRLLVYSRIWQGYLELRYNRKDDFAPIEHQANTFFINTEQGTSHSISGPYFREYSDASTIITYDDSLVDCIKITTLGRDTLMFLGVSKNEFASSNKAVVYSMASSRETNSCDTSMDAINSPTVIKRVSTPVHVEFWGFAPDGLSYQMKKFRNLEIEGVFPSDIGAAPYLLLSTDNNKYLDEAQWAALAPKLYDDQSSPDDLFKRNYPHRYGMNTRGHFVNMLIKSAASIIAGNTDVYNKVNIEISDIRFLWGYLGRTIGRRNFKDPI